MSKILNIAGYQFVTVHDTFYLQQAVQTLLGRLGCRGSVVFSPEGINFMLAGTEKSIHSFLRWLAADARFAKTIIKKSYSENIPFSRLRVKRKAQLVPANDDGIQPEQYTSKRITPKELKAWYEQGKQFNILDTRNDFEYRYGTFEQAEQVNLRRFRQFESALSANENLDKTIPLVTFCTGGIRCEKAAPIAEKLGFEEVYQLDGGILAYFEECGAAHYDGSCFVFDEREALTADLKPVN